MFLVFFFCLPQVILGLYLLNFLVFFYFLICFFSNPSKYINQGVFCWKSSILQQKYTHYNITATIEVSTVCNRVYLYFSYIFANQKIIGQLPRVSREDPERIRVDSVFETFVCSLFFIYSLFVCLQIFSFSLFQPSLFIQYSTEECSTVQVFIWCLDTIA